jgi:hypothetical protein
MNLIKIFSFIIYFFIISLSFVLYNNINDTLPVYRGITTKKNLFWATRIQFINLLTFFAIIIIGNSFLRYKDFLKSKRVYIYLLLTITLKGSIEFVSLFVPVIYTYSFFLLIPIIGIGLSFSIYHSKSLFINKSWENLDFTTVDKILLLLIGIIYICLNIPALEFILKFK